MNSGRLPLENSSRDGEYCRNQVRSIGILMVLGLILVTAVLLSLWAGSYETPINELLRGVAGKASNPKINVVVRNVRLPRICTAVVAGAGLGVVGCVLQAILDNPLASASTLGVSQGASFGAAFAIIGLNAGASHSGGILISMAAFAGSMGVAFVILGLSRLSQISPESIVLAGVAISSMFTGATTLLQYFADEVELTTLTFWTFGDLGSTTYGQIGFMFLVVLFTSIYFIFHRWDFNALLAGTETAASLGIHVRRLILVNMVLCCLAASTIVSYVGLINFIGLVAPHIVRRLVGNNHIYLIPGAILAGASLLLMGDLLARTIVSPVILPIGAITSFLGAPLFLYLLFKRRKSVC